MAVSGVIIALVILSAAGAHSIPSNDPVYSPRSYVASIDPRLVEETRQKVYSFRSSLDIIEPAWTEGPPTSDILSIASYWTGEYDWSAVQSQINTNFSHYISTVSPPGGSYNRSLDIHFIHERSAREDAIPVLMLHGWPSTSLEWREVIPGLNDPGDDSKPAFHVVAPDLPGYGFSPAPTAPGLGYLEHGAVFASLMQQLGYEKYAVYSTDLGFVAALGLLADYSERVINHITDFYFVFPNSTDLQRYAANETTPEENRAITAANAFLSQHEAYAQIHSTLPLSIAHALNDSPLGFLAWMYQIVYTVSDKPVSAPDLITEALLLYFPGVYGNIRSYKELFVGLTALTNGQLKTTNVPTSALQFGGTNHYPALSNVVYIVSPPLSLSFLAFVLD